AVFIAEGRDDTLLGCVFLKPKSDALYHGKLAIRPARQGEEIGRRLFEVSIDEARARNLSEIKLQARVELTENHAAFAAMGFRELGRTANNGYNLPTSVTMRYTI
ncbi:MAG: GNAT family N-acetyltransferase, partial [Pseudomonadota bacterium]|nr:GNAT family N-acetyltransferase [Pseudomonadota bacterium]